jgi:hypothetical protein
MVASNGGYVYARTAESCLAVLSKYPSPPKNDTPISRSPLHSVSIQNRTVEEQRLQTGARRQEREEVAIV